MGKLRQIFQGKKTYVVALGGALTAIGAYFTGDIDSIELAKALFNAVVAATIRAGIGNATRR